MKPISGIYIFFLSIAVVFGAHAADMIILESSQSFTIYSQFEQPLSASEKAGILPYSPLQIIKPNALLGDGITRAMECLYRQKTYYLLKDERGSLIGDQAQMKLLKSCAPVGDTVEVNKSDAVRFSEKSFSFSASISSPLPKGVRLVILFKSDNAYYALQTAPIERFGWISAVSRVFLKRIKQTLPVADSSVSETFHAEIAARFGSANALYRTFFDRLNGSVGGQKSVPQWTESSGNAEYSWSLSEPYNHTGELDESASYLVKEIQDILIGKPFIVRQEKGRILISSKSKAAP